MDYTTGFTMGGRSVRRTSAASRLAARMTQCAWRRAGTVGRIKALAERTNDNATSVLEPILPQYVTWMLCV